MNIIIIYIYRCVAIPIAILEIIAWINYKLTLCGLSTWYILSHCVVKLFLCKTLLTLLNTPHPPHTHTHTGSPTHEITRKDHQQFSIKLEQTSVDCQLDGAQSISTDKPHSTTPSKYNIESPPSRSSSRASTPRRLPQRLPLKFSTRPHIKLSIDKSNTGDKSVCNRTGELTFGSTPFSQPAYQKLSASNQNETKQVGDRLGDDT